MANNRKLKLKTKSKKVDKKIDKDKFVKSVKERNQDDNVTALVPLITDQNVIQLSKDSFADIKRRTDTKRLMVVEVGYDKILQIMNELTVDKIKLMSSRSLVGSLATIMQAIGDFLSRDIVVTELDNDDYDIPVNSYEDLILKREALKNRVDKIYDITAKEVKRFEDKKVKNKNK